MRGRKPKPSCLKIVEGNRGKKGRRQYERPAARSEKALPDWLEFPDWMSEEGRRFGEQTARHLLPDGLLEPLYLGPFLGMCSCYGLWSEAQEELAGQGFTITDNRGVVRKNPYVTIEKNFGTLFLKFAEDFGLTPMSRQRLNIPGPRGPDLQDLLR